MTVTLSSSKIKDTYIEMLRDIAFEAVHDGCSVVEKCTDVRRRDIRPCAIERNPVPRDELILSAVVVVVLGCT